MSEEWRDVKGYEGFYKVSNQGRVLSLRSNKLRMPVLNPQNGYFAMVLVGNGVKKTEYLHRIVANAFVDNPDNEKCVNHKNEIKTDCRAENLEWCSQKYNNTYNGKTQRCCKRIMQIDEKTNAVIKIWNSAREIDNSGIANFKNVSAVCRGKRPRAGGYVWKFERSDGKWDAQ